MWPISYKTFQPYFSMPRFLGMSWTPLTQGLANYSPRDKPGLLTIGTRPLPFMAPRLRCFWPHSGTSEWSQQRPSDPQKPTMFIIWPFTAQDCWPLLTPKLLIRNWRHWQWLSRRILKTHLSVGICVQSAWQMSFGYFSELSLAGTLHATQFLPPLSFCSKQSWLRIC